MYLELYVDSLALLNFTVNLCLLFLTDKKLGGTATPPGVFAGAAAGSILFILPLLSPMPAGVAFLTGAALEIPVMLLITFRRITGRGFLRTLGIFAEYSMLLGSILVFAVKLVPGVRGFFHLPFAVPGMAVAVSLFLAVAKRNSRENEVYCEAVLYWKDRKIKIPALLDSGNALIEPVSAKPVSLVRGSFFRELFRKEETQYYRVIPFHSVGQKNGILKGFFIPQMEVIRKGVRFQFEDVCIAVWEDEGKERNVGMILNPGLWETKE